MPVARSRLTSALLQYGVRWLGQVALSLRQLWLEVTGTLFLALGVLAGPSAWKEYQRYEHGGSVWRLLLVMLFIFTTFSCGVASFLKSRRLH